MASPEESIDLNKNHKGVVRPHRSINEYLTSDRMVKIYVGPARKIWNLNEDLLCDRVPFFEAVFKGKFKEGTEKTMDLPEDDPIAFAKLVDFVYNEALDCKNCAKAQGRPSPDVNELLFGPDHEMMWCKLWILADKFNMEELAAATLHQFELCLAYRRHNHSHDSRTTISTEAVLYTYENTLEGSPLRILLLEEVGRIWFSTIDSQSRKTKIQEVTFANDNLYMDLLELIRKHTSSGFCWNGHNGGSCYFHDDAPRSQNEGQQRHRMRYSPGPAHFFHPNLRPQM